MRKLVALAVVAVLVGVACGTDEQAIPTTQPEATATQAPAATGINDKGTKTFTDESFEAEIELDNFYFEPTFIKSPGGATAKIELHNEGSVTHTFTVPGLNVDETLQAGAKKEITLNIGTETRYEFYCRFHKDQGMRGAFQPH